MPDTSFIRTEIEHMQRQVDRLRGEQRSGISRTSADALLERMPNKIDDL
jgi:hypothetical protein